MSQHTCSPEAQKNRLTGTKAQIKSRNRETRVCDRPYSCLGMSCGNEWGIIIIKGILGEDQSINDLEYGRRIC